MHAGHRWNLRSRFDQGSEQMTVFRPHGSRVLIKPEAPPEKSAGGIFIPETARDKKFELRTGTVIAMGEGFVIETGVRSGERWPMPNGKSVLPDVLGKRVYYFANEGIATPIKIDGVLHEVLRADNVDAFVNDDGEIVPLHDRVMVKRAPSVTRSSGGIFLPATAQTQVSEGTVVAIGQGKIKFSGDVCPMSVSIGMRVMFGKYAGTDMAVGGELLVMIRDEEITCVLEDEEGEIAREAELTETLLESEPAGGT
jgi:chaperonin GroES